TPFLCADSGTIRSYRYVVYAFIASDACWIVNAGGNESQKGCPPFFDWKYDECCASAAAIWAIPVLNWFVTIPPLAPAYVQDTADSRAAAALTIDFSSSNVPSGYEKLTSAETVGTCPAPLMIPATDW